MGLDSEKFSYLMFNFSAQTSANMTQVIDDDSEHDEVRLVGRHFGPEAGQEEEGRLRAAGGEEDDALHGRP
eukprot:4635638-Pyramimonas_sp.AAC.1